MATEFFPFRKDFPGRGIFAYVAPLTFGRGRIVLTAAHDDMSILDGW